MAVVNFRKVQIEIHLKTIDDLTLFSDRNGEPELIENSVGVEISGEGISMKCGTFRSKQYALDYVNSSLLPDEADLLYYDGVLI